jgi:hypothetical protein
MFNSSFPVGNSKLRLSGRTAPTGIRAILHLVPHFRPFFTPLHRPLAHHTDFLRQVGFRKLGLSELGPLILGHFGHGFSLSQAFSDIVERSENSARL